MGKDTPLHLTSPVTQPEGGGATPGHASAGAAARLPGRVEESKPQTDACFPGSIDEPPRWRSGADGSR
ncbi:unnamed protein product [Merluccius merluccius]